MFYTNGVSIANREHETMENGDGLNPSEYTDDAAENGLRISQGALALPVPNSSDNYYLFHTPLEYPTDDLFWHSPFLYYSSIDMDANGGLGIVLEKNIPILEDTLNIGQITTVKHANGRDWWMLINRIGTNEYYRILVTPDGVENLGLMEIGSPIPFVGVGQAAFSPDGKYYARINSISYEIGQIVDIYDFDRCSGFLSNHQQLIYNDTALSTGIAFSPSSEYLYVSSFRHIYQFHMGSEDVLATRQLVANMDNFLFGSQLMPFYLAQNAPDGKIYIATQSTVPYLHVIHQPDRACPDCGIELHGIELPTRNGTSMPNYPNYRLGPLDGSPCDTLGIDNVPVAKFRFDQDTSDHLRVEFTDLSYYEPTEWHWDFGDNTSSGAKNTSRQYATGGAYEVCLTVSNDNGEDTFCQTLFLGTVATGERDIKVGITLFPNPAREGVHVILSDGYLPKAGTVTFYDAVGQMRLSKPVWTGWNNVDLEGLPPGIYFYEVKDGEVKLGGGKLVVER